MKDVGFVGDVRSFNRAQNAFPSLTSDLPTLPSTGQVGAKSRGPGAGRADWAGELAACVLPPQHCFLPAHYPCHKETLFREFFCLPASV